VVIKIKIYEDETLDEGINLALGHRLYVSGWALSYELTRARQQHPWPVTAGKKLAIMFKDKNPICLAFLASHSQLLAFCKKSERGQGYASACVKAIKPSRNSWAGEGVIGTVNFWKRLGVNCSSR
jgi:hypothetical protein